MIKHIVFWKLKEENKEENMMKIKNGLEGLVGQIDGLLHAEVGVNYNGGEYDLCLYSEYRDREALLYYRDHEKHKEVQKIVHAAMTERAAVDFEA